MLSVIGMTEQTVGINWTETIQEYVRLIRACQQRLEATPIFRCLAKVIRFLNETFEFHVKTIDDDCSDDDGDSDNNQDDIENSAKYTLRMVGQNTK